MNGRGEKWFTPYGRWINSFAARGQIEPFPYPTFIPVSEMVAAMNSDVSGEFVYYEEAR